MPGGETCGEAPGLYGGVFLRGCSSLPPYRHHHHSLLPSLLASFSSRDLELSLRQRAASNEKADKAQGFRLVDDTRREVLTGSKVTDRKRNARERQQWVTHRELHARTVVRLTAANKPLLKIIKKCIKILAERNIVISRF